MVVADTYKVMESSAKTTALSKAKRRGNVGWEPVEAIVAAFAGDTMHTVGNGWLILFDISMCAWLHTVRIDIAVAG